MSDGRLKFASYKYKKDNIEVTVKISLYKRELGLSDHLLAPRFPFYIKIENGIKYNEKPLIVEAKNTKDINEKFERCKSINYNIKESEPHRIAWIVTEQSATLNKIQNKVNSFIKACQTVQELYRY